MITHQAAATPRSVACPKALPQSDLFVLSTSTRFCVCVSLFSLIFQTVPTGHFMPHTILVHLAKHIKSGGWELGSDIFGISGGKRGRNMQKVCLRSTLCAGNNKLTLCRERNTWLCLEMWLCSPHFCVFYLIVIYAAVIIALAQHHLCLN